MSKQGSSLSVAMGVDLLVDAALDAVIVRRPGGSAPRPDAEGT
jgi:hypothetical protein